MTNANLVLLEKYNVLVVSVVLLLFASFIEPSRNPCAAQTKLKQLDPVSRRGEAPPAIDRNSPSSVGEAFLYQAKSSDRLPEILSIHNGSDVILNSPSGLALSTSSVAISPNDPQIAVGVNILQRSGATPAETTNGGVTWTTSSESTTLAYQNRGFHSVGMDRSSPSHVYVAYDELQCQVAVAVSEDLGATWNHHIVASPYTWHEDCLSKPHLTVDNSSGSPYKGRVYCGWERYTWEGDIEVSYSTNYGSDWSTSAQISSALNAHTTYQSGVNIRTGPTGNVYAVWGLADDGSYTANGIGFSKSTNGGQTWTAAAKMWSINGLSISGALEGQELDWSAKNMRVWGWPCMAVNQHNGNIYVVYPEVKCNTSETDIYMRKSTNEGFTWSDAVLINTDGECTGKDHWCPWITSDPVTGALVILFLDSRNSSSNNRVETFAAVSYDDGDTWEDGPVSDDNWDGRYLPNYYFNYTCDYIAVDANYGHVIPMWSDKSTVNGDMQAKTSVFDLQCIDNLEICRAAIYDEAMYSVRYNLTLAGCTGENYTIEDGGHAIMRAGGGTGGAISGIIKFEPGFHAKRGGYLHAFLQDSCTEFAKKYYSGSSPSSESDIHSDDWKHPILEKSHEYGNIVFQAFPNPFRGRSTVVFAISEEGPVRLDVFNALGQSMAQVLSEVMPAGTHTLSIDATDWPTGTYSYQLTTRDGRVARRVSLIR